MQSPTHTLESVRLHHYRNYRSLTLRLGPGFNVLSGANAQGKTNFLESIALLSTTRVLRGQRENEAILEGESKAIVEADLTDERTTVAIHLERGQRKKAFLNGMTLPRAADLLGRLPAVCITSLDLAIAKGEPSDRRLFLDLDLSTLYPGYLKNLAVYKRALEQRNALLRQDHGWIDPKQFEPWELQLAEHGAAIRRQRVEYVAQLQERSLPIQEEMGHGEALQLAYAAKDDAMASEHLLEALEASRGADLARGGTSVGPHRDEMLVEINGREARLFGSQGQQRTSVLAIKLASLELARSVLGAPPLLLLDDMLSDLDESRRSLLVDAIVKRVSQAVLTCTEAAAAGPRVLREATVFEVSAGEIRAS